MPEALTHEQAAELLPWLINESLSDVERDAVRAHASSCVLCRRELESLRELQGSLARLAADEPIPVPDMRRINARIDAFEARRNRGRRLLESLRSWLGDPWRAAVAMQAALLLALGAAWIWPGDPAPVYTTLTTPQSLPDGHYLRIVFDPTLEATEISGLLDEHRLSIVEGPTPRGVYTLRAPDDDAVLDKLAATLLDEPGVLFAQPVTGGVP